MICFERFFYTNFEGVGAAGIEYIFADGMTRLIGKNGVGKSSLANGIYFCLTGKPYKNKIVIKSLINTTNKKNLKTELIFRKNDTRYKIVRNLAPDKFEIYKEVEGKYILEKHLSSKDPYQNILDNILGCDRKVLEQVLIRSNLKTNSFLALEKQEKRDYLDKTVDIFILQRIKKKNGLKMDELKNEISSLDSKLQQVLVKITAEEENINRLEKLKDEINEGRKATIEEKLAKVKKDFSDLKAEIVILKQDLKEAETEKEKLDLQIVSLKEELKALKDSSSKTYSDSCIETEKNINLNFQEQTQTLEKKIKENLDKYTKDMEALDVANTKILKEIKMLNDSLVSEKKQLESSKKESLLKLSTASANLLREKNSAQKDIDVFNQKFAFFKENCGACDKLKVLETSENIASKQALIEKLDLEIESIGKDLVDTEKDFEARLKVLDNSIQESVVKKNNQQISYEKQFNTIDTDYATEQKISKNALKELVSKKINQIEFEKQTLQLKFQTEVASFEKDFSKKISLVDMTSVTVLIKEKQQAIVFKTDAAKKIADEGQTLKKELEDINKEGEEIVDKKALNEYVEESLILKKKIAAKTRDLEEYGAINNVLTKDNGIRNWILKKFLGFINKKINDYLEEMDETIIFTFNENLEENFKDKIRAGLSFGNLSEGQKKRIDLAILLTFLDVANMQARNKFNLIFLDEILFGLHESIIPLIIKIFEKRKEYQEVIIMEHNKVSDTYFDRIFEFKQTKEFFTIMNLKK